MIFIFLAQLFNRKFCDRGRMKTNVFVVSLFLVTNVLFSVVAGSTIYGYYTLGSTSSLVSINPETGASTTVCDLSSLPPLQGASSSYKYTQTGDSTLFFYSIASSGAISLVTVDPTTCKSNSTVISGLNSGQNLVRDIKYDNINEKLYMVFPNPFCMHGSLNQINPETAAVITHLTNVGDPQGLSQTAAVSGKSGSYYFVGIPIGEPEVLTYQLNKVQLSTGNTSAINLANNDLDIGDMWGSNYTLNVAMTSAGETIVGAVTSSTTVQECDPSGFYSINPSTGNVTCTHGPIEYSVAPLADLDFTTSLYYQLFYDAHGAYYLYTFDASKNQLVASAQCDVCAHLSVLSVVP
jgi:hypothetical protein